GSYAFMISFAIWMLAYILTGREGILAFIDSDLVRGLAEIVYYALPKSSEIVELAYPKVSSLQTGADWTPLWSSALTAAAAYGLGLLRFRRMDL
ncbi:MAG: hypothetical protein ACE5GA_06910, partial [Candidatus Zixiibacteriota bacterium]